MSFREILLPWDSQPQEVVQVDWGNPITSGLVAIYSAAASFEGVSGALGAMVNGSFGAKQRGIAFTPESGFGAVSFPQRSSHDVLGAITCMAVARATSTSADALIACKGTSNGATNSPYNFGMNSGGNVYLNRAAGGTIIWRSTETPLTSSEPCVIASSQVGTIQTSPTFYHNGALLGTTLQYNGGGSGAAVASTNGLRIGSRVDNAIGWPGDIYLFAVWSRVLSAAEHRNLADNPWQLFAPQTTWVPVSAGGGASTHDTTGALAGAGSAIAGSAAHIVIHGTSGALTGQGSSVVGSAARTRAHPTSGALTGPGSVVDGAAVHNTVHPTSGALVGPGSEIDGAADHVVPGGTHDTTGALTGQGAVIAGTAAHVAIHGTTGVLVGAGAVLDGAAERVGAAVSHDTTGALVGMGAAIVGAASWVAFGPEALGSLVGSTRKTMQSRPARVMSSSRPAAIQRGRR
jgi:hypothetical protein